MVETPPCVEDYSPKSVKSKVVLKENKPTIIKVKPDTPVTNQHNPHNPNPNIRTNTSIELQEQGGWFDEPIHNQVSFATNEVDSLCHA